MDKQKDTLYIPQGIKKEREYFDGFGMKEFKITMVSVLIALLVSGVAYLIIRIQIVSVLIILIVPSVTVLGVVKDASNVSVVDQIHFILEDSKTQNHYPYIAKDEWE